MWGTAGLPWIASLWHLHWSVVSRCLRAGRRHILPSAHPPPLLVPATHTDCNACMQVTLQSLVLSEARVSQGWWVLRYAVLRLSV